VTGDNSTTMLMRKIIFRASMLLALVFVFPLQGLAEEDEFEQGLALIKSHQYYEAIEAFSAVIGMIPGDFEAHNYRGIARAYQKDYDGAIEDYTMALSIKPGYAEAFSNRGFAWVKKGNLGKALDDFSRAIEIEPNFVDALNSQAWILATSSDKRYRNGKKAVDLALKAMDINETVDSLDTLSAAYAANGQLDEAVASQKRVIEMMVRQNRTDGLNPYIAHLENYIAGKPLRISYAVPISQARTADVIEKKSIKADLKPETKEKKSTKADLKLEKPVLTSQKLNAGSLGPMPYTIQVSAYRDPQKSLDAATGLKNKGDPAFTCPVYIPGQGQWHRVFIGFFQSLDEAKKAADRLKKRKFGYIQIANKPLAVQVGLADSYKEAREFKSRLRGKGYMAYSLLDRKEQTKTRILIGAYSTEHEARRLMEQLQKDGFTTRLLPR
jgi:tetratricopeptide (TPR) repeat protein